MGVREAVLQDGYSDAPEPHDDIALLRLAGTAKSPPQRLMSGLAGASIYHDGAMGEVAGFGLTQPAAEWRGARRVRCRIACSRRSCPL